MRRPESGGRQGPNGRSGPRGRAGPRRRWPGLPGPELAWRLRHLHRRGLEALAGILLGAALRLRACRWLPRRLLARLERRLIGGADYPVFDGALYLARNPDVADAGLEPLGHYLAHGWSEGRDPSGWLDDRRYRRRAGLAPGDRVSALGHYLAVGRAKGLAPGGAGWTGGSTGGQAASGSTDPGRAEAGENPLGENPLGEAARVMAALARLGSVEANAARGARKGPGNASGPGAGDDLQETDRDLAEKIAGEVAGGAAGENSGVAAAEAAAAGGDPVVDVIVPVYGGRAETLTCLASVLQARCETACNLVVVDDCGPDRRLRMDLRRLARRGLVDLVVQPGNRGFVASVNAGMRRNLGRDVVWLNADTEVFDGWLDRLRAAAGPGVATVTPLTNNGTICSYPRFDADNCDPPECGWDEIDRIAARVNAGATVEAPTCVGFCTYVRRAAIEAVGMLDEEAFGAGYGEENDFSCRAARAGLRNLIAGDVFVYHAGATSFGDSRAGRVEAAMKVVERRNPGYRRAIRRFQADDPVAPLRREIDVARLARMMRRRRNVLVVSHSRGGGTQQHVEEEAARLARSGAGVLFLTGGAGGPDTARIGHAGVGPLPSLATLPLGGADLVLLMRRLGVSEVQVHHLADFGRAGAEKLVWLMDALNLPFDFVVHDYLPVCPRINLADTAGMYCGEPGEAGCRRCLVRRRSEFGAPDIRRWRREYGRLLGMARHVRVPDRDVAARLMRYFPRLSGIVVRPHERGLQGRLPPLRRPGTPPKGRPLRIATIGAIGPIEGFDVLLGLAGEIHARAAAVELSVIGFTRNDHTAQAAGIEVTGAYDNARVGDAIDAVDPDLILIASTWPETYCYTLSHALESGRPVAGFDIGAIGTRLRDAGVEVAGRGGTLPLELARDPAALLDRLVELAGAGAARARPLRPGETAGGAAAPARSVPIPGVAIPGVLAPAASDPEV